ncbi:MAG: GSCFA domain-containing protein [Flavobacteriales bacterium]
MNPPVYRTVCPLPKFDFSVHYDDYLVFAGSCFAENISTQFNRYFWNAAVNSHGIIFHPMPLADAIEEASRGKTYYASDLFLESGQWCSWSHHGRFRRPDPEQALQEINHSIEYHHGFMKKANVLFVTFGTAWGYYIPDDRVVANCHRAPSSTFNKYLTTHTEIVERWSHLLGLLDFISPELKVIFSVSPVRHLKDGMHENQLSKSHLLLAIQTLVESFPHQCFYFPTYEIFMDDLRDYRYYASDMLHPSAQGIEHVWNIVRQTLIDEESNAIMNDIHGLVLQLEHRYSAGAKAADLAAIQDEIFQRIREGKDSCN